MREGEGRRDKESLAVQRGREEGERRERGRGREEGERRERGREGEREHRRRREGERERGRGQQKYIFPRLREEKKTLTNTSEERQRHLPLQEWLSLSMMES